MRQILMRICASALLPAGAFACCGTWLRAQAAPSCDAPEFRQFDFWAGDWDAFDAGGPRTPSARIRVERILDGCVIKETYEGTNGAQGQSFSIFDKTRRVWHQTWVTNRGVLLIIEGTFHDGSMELKGSDLTAKGKPRLVRGIWKPETGGVRETAFTSLDNGATWTQWFDLDFRPHAEAAAAAPKH
jgi:hypothetical protein